MPNIILCLDAQGTLFIWCENSLKVRDAQQDNLHLYLAHKMKLGVTDGVMPQASWINIHRYYNNFSKPPEFIFGNSKLGSYSLNSNTLVTLAVLRPNRELEIYTMTNLFVVGKQKVVQKIYTYRQSELIENLHSILKISIEKDNVNIVGLDCHQNILEMEFNIVRPDSP